MAVELFVLEHPLNLSWIKDIVVENIFFLDEFNNCCFIS
jgi:hypothetical protein